MGDEKINMDKLFREKLERFSAQPPPHVWDNLQGQMLANSKRKRTILFAWISAAAVVVFAFMAGWYFNNSDNIDAPVLANQQTNQQTNQTTPTDPIKTQEENIENTLIVESGSENEQLTTENKNDLIIETNNNKEQALLATAVAAKNGNERAKIVSFSNSERIKMQQMIAKNMPVKQFFTETELAKKSSRTGISKISDSDDLIVAANASIFENSAKKEKGWKMGMHLSPGYSSHVSAHSDSYSQNINYSGETGNGNIGGGLSVQYKTSKKLRIESGVYYAQNGQKSKNSFELFARKNDSYDYVFASAENLQSNMPANGFSNSVVTDNGNLLMNSTAGVIEMKGAPKGVQINADPEKVNARFDNTLVTDGSFAQVFDFIEIPLYLRYSLLDSKFGIEIIGGLNAGLVVGNNAYIDNSYGLQNIGSTQDISTINISGTVGVGASYDLGKHLSFAVEPRLNYYFNSINTNADIVFRPYRIGFYTGLYYEF